MKIKDITEYLEAKVPLENQEDYDNSGLIIGSPEQDITSILLSLDITEEILDEAIRKNCNLIISHHPLIFRGMKRLTGSDYVQRLVIRAIREQISVYAIHTNLDNALDGLNALFCRKIGIKNGRILSPGKGSLNKLVTFCPEEYAERVRTSLFEAGAGHIGNYDCCSYNIHGEGTFRASDKASPFVGEIDKLHTEHEVRIEVIFPEYLGKRLIKSLILAHPYEEVAYDIYPLNNTVSGSGAGMIGEIETETDLMEFLNCVKSVTGLPLIRHSKDTGRKIKSVAVCTGSGSFLIHDAIRAGADILLTADLKYHDFFEADSNLILADIGHYESEQFVKEWIYSILIEKFPTFAILISETNTNPVKYY
jgi:dinuclear metal center YbgI/SA1388 family protein